MQQTELQSLLTAFAQKLATKDYFESKKEREPGDTGAGNTIHFSFDGKNYKLEWNGWWNRSDFYEYTIEELGNTTATKISGVKYLD